MRTEVYFIRHGQVYNPQRIWYGRMPFYHLTKKGRFQIEKVAKHLSDKNISLIYSSPLLRARQSARILRNKLKIRKIHFSQKISEVKSSFEGSTEAYLKSIKYNVFASKENKIEGETIEDLADRMRKFVARIVKLHKGKHVVVVSHGDPIMMVKAQAEGLPIKNESIRPGRKDYIKPGEIYLLKI